MVSFVSLPCGLFLAASFVAVRCGLFLVVSSILAISGGVIYYCAICSMSGSVCCIAGQSPILVVPFVMMQYELFLAILLVTL